MCVHEKSGAPQTFCALDRHRARNLYRPGCACQWFLNIIVSHLIFCPEIDSLSFFIIKL